MSASPASSKTRQPAGWFRLRFGLRLLFVATACIGVWLALQLAKFKTHELRPAGVTASAVYDEETLPRRAFDGDMETYWAAGDNPVQWIEADLGAKYDLSRVTLTVSQSGRWQTAHEIYVSDLPIGNNASKARLVYRIDGVTDARQIIQVDIPREAGAVGRYVQVRTVESMGWVSWREIDFEGAKPVDPRSVWGRLGLGAPQRAN